MSLALFVSDIHISSPSDPKCALFLRVLEQARARGVNDLFLVGDIFDLWISDRRYFTEQYSLVIKKLRDLQASGMRIHYFEGNHDLDLAHFWRRQLGVEVYTQATFFNLNGVKFRVEHGDQMDPSDRGYRFLRWLLRTPLLVFMQRHLPNWAVRRIGERASRVSREYTSNIKVSSDTRARDMIREHALRAFREEPFAVSVSGHLHVNEDAEYQVEGQRVRCINLGTWLKEPFLLRVEGSLIAVESVASWRQD